MGLLSNNSNTQLVIAIEYVNVLLRAGYSREDIVMRLGNKKWGKVSSSCKLAYDYMRNNHSFNEAISKVYQDVPDKNMKSFISALNAEEGVQINSVLSNLSDQIIKQKQLSAESMIDSMAGSMQKCTMVIAIPIFIFIIIMLQDALSIFIQLSVRPSVDYFLYMITGLLLLLFIMKMRYKE